jgi:hypothetical protein
VLVRTIRAECTDRMLISGERHLHATWSEYVNHYNTGRSHQRHDIGPAYPDNNPNNIPTPSPSAPDQPETVLGGLINDVFSTTFT